MIICQPPLQIGEEIAFKMAEFPTFKGSWPATKYRSNFRSHKVDLNQIIHIYSKTFLMMPITTDYSV